MVYKFVIQLVYKDLIKFNKFNMLHKSPSQRFQRTRNIHLSPNMKQSQVQDLQKYVSSGQKVRYLSPSSSVTNLRTVKGIENFFRLNQEKRQIQKRKAPIPNIFQEYQQNKKQLQLSELFNMISFIKNEQRKTERISNLNSLLQEQQLLRTPRENDEILKQHQVEQGFQKYQIYLPICQTFDKKQNKPETTSNIDAFFYNQSNQLFSTKQLQVLLQKIQKDTDRNNIKIDKTQKCTQIKQFTIKKNIPSQEFEQIPTQIQKFVKNEFNILKNQMQIQKNMLQSWVSEIVEQKIKQQRIINKFQGKLQQQINKVYLKMNNISQFFSEQLRQLENKTCNQIFTLNDIIEQKVTLFKESLIDQMLKISHKQTDQLKETLQYQKNRLNSIQLKNQVLFDEFKEEMENIREKLTLIQENQNNHHKYKEQLLNLFEMQKQLMYEQLISEVNIKTRQNQSQIWRQIKNLSKKLQNSLIKTLPQQKQLNPQHICKSQKDISGPSTPSEQSVDQFHSQKFNHNLALELKIKSVISQFSFLQQKDWSFQINESESNQIKKDQASEIIDLNYIQKQVDNSQGN